MADVASVARENGAAIAALACRRRVAVFPPTTRTPSGRELAGAPAACSPSPWTPADVVGSVAAGRGAALPGRRAGGPVALRHRSPARHNDERAGGDGRVAAGARSRPCIRRGWKPCAGEGPARLRVAARRPRRDAGRRHHNANPTRCARRRRAGRPARTALAVSATWARSASRVRRSTPRSAPTRARASSSLWTVGAQMPPRYAARAALRRPAALLAALADASAGNATVTVKGSRSCAYGAVVRRCSRLNAAPGAHCMLLASLSQWLQGATPELGLLPRLPVPDLPRRDGGDDRAADRPGRTMGDPPPRGAQNRPAGPRLRQTHLAKTGTPTMGGVLILIGIGVSTLLWFDWSNRFVWIVLLVTLGFGASAGPTTGARSSQDPEGMPSREKFFWQSLIGLRGGAVPAFSVSETSNLRVLSCSSSAGCRRLRTTCPQGRPDGAVLQDDQLSAGRVRLHHPDLVRDRRHQQCGQPDRRPGRPGDHAGGDGRLGARRLRLRHRQLGVLALPAVPLHPGPGELLSSARRWLGAGLAFLWFNTHPAQVFMGDVGALALAARWARSP